MSTTKKSFIQEDLEWLESRIANLKAYVDANPIQGMADRKITIGTGRGEKEQVTATIEAQIKSVRDTLKELPALLEAVDKLREREEGKKIQVRGQSSVPSMMKTQHT